MYSLREQLIFLILQFLDEENFKDSLHSLEKESGLFFNMKYFEDCVTNGEWDEVEKYLFGFTKVEDNISSIKIVFAIRKQKYLEALDKNDNSKAVEILMNELKVFSTFNQIFFNELVLLLMLGNSRENPRLSGYGDTKSARAKMLNELKKLIQADPLFRDKLQFPALEKSRLLTLIKPSLNWQPLFCKCSKPNPNIKSLRTCEQPNDALDPSPVTNPLMGSLPNAKDLFPFFPNCGVQKPLGSPLEGWMGTPSSMPHLDISAGPIGITAPNNAGHVPKRQRPFNEVNKLANNIEPITCLGPTGDLPKTLVANLNQGSAVKSMDFKPFNPTILLVGTNTGDIAIWEVPAREMLVLRNFKVWEIRKCSITLQATLANENTASVNRVIWSPDGAFFGVAYSKHIVHIYSYHGGEDLRNHLEFDAHVGNVSDIAFANPKRKLCIITCGEDKIIKVWDAGDGTKRHTFEGHDAPVYSLCPSTKGNIPFLLSTSIDGKIKVWQYDNAGSIVDYNAPRRAPLKMAYSADKTRLFSCGTTKEGESFIVEWDDKEGAVKRTYVGLGKGSVEVVQFDISKRFLAAGDEFAIKFWDMDNVNVLTTIDAEGGLPASPSIRFSKEGMLLAVSTKENGVKVLANTNGTALIRSIEGQTLDASSRITPRYASKNGEGQILLAMNPRITNKLDKRKIWKLTELEEPSQLRFLRLPDNLLSVKICRLIYTNSGEAILALACNALHKLWKWRRNDRNAVGKANVNISPQLCRPSSGILMTNHISQTNQDEAVPCFALSKNDSYVISASGGNISVFNISTFKMIDTLMTPPPAATFLAFHPEDSNIIAIGMDDSSVQIYYVRLNKVKIKLSGHQKKVTGLAFSSVLNVLVSSGADAQLCVWSMDGWDKQATNFLQIPSGRNAAPHSRTHIQFHPDHVHLLVVHETQLAIYGAPKLDVIKQWAPQDSSCTITDATYSCDGKSIYASFEDGSVSVFIAATLSQRCRISSTAYLTPSPSSTVHPVVVAANPVEPNQFALGLSDGGVLVLEPLEEEGKWGTMPPLENGAVISVRSVPNQ